ncbi:MAG: sugar phosphate nucleotidyltransferase [bacterium]
MIEQVVIVAGGYAKRMQSILVDTPKVLAPIQNKPFINYILDTITKQGIKSCHLCLGHLSKKIINILPQITPESLKVTYSVEPYALGVIGALAYAIDFLDNKFLFLFGDVYPTVSIKVLNKVFDSKKMDVLMTVGKNEPPPYLSNVAIRDSLVTLYSKDPNEGHRTHLDLGVYVVKRDCLKKLSLHTKIDESDFFKDLIARKRMGAFEWNIPPLQIGDPQGYFELAELVKDGKLPKPTNKQTVN